MKRNKNFYLNRIIAIVICLVVALGVILTPVIAKEFLTNNNNPISEYELLNNETNANAEKNNLDISGNNSNTPKTKLDVNTIKTRSANSSFGLKPGQYVDIDLTNNNEGISQIAVQFSKDGGSTWSDQVIAERLGNDSKQYNAYPVYRSKVYEAIAPSGFENYNSIKVINKNNGNEITSNLDDNQIGTDIAFKFWNEFVNGGQWVTYYSSSQEINVNKWIDKDGTNELYPLKTTFYNYYTDNEVTNGWGNILEREARGDWEPQNTFNGFIGLFVESGNNWLYPLYFGNFYNKPDNYFPNFKNKVNNSSGLTNYNTSVRNLVDKRLSANGNVQYNGIELPVFDSSFLANNNIGQTVNTLMPFRKYNSTTSGNIHYYGFNSDVNNTFNNDGIVDNIWFSRNNSLWQTTPSGEWQINYSKDPKYRLRDALSKYSSPIEPDGVGFFPFDTSTEAGGNTGNNAWNFAFGMKSEVNFYLPSGGAEDGEALKIDYTGDDDLWIFLDDVLVLDIGGDHKKSGGEIDFATLKSTYKNNGYDVTNDQTYAPNRVEEFPSLFGSDGNQQFNNNDPIKMHKLTMFYMERGKVESNLHLNFVLTPTHGELELEKEVNVANVNNALKGLVETNDFNFNIYKDKDTKGAYSPLSNFEYKYIKNEDFLTKHTDSNGGLTINSNYISKFNDPYFEGDSAKIIEADTSPMIYDTTYEMTDLYTGESIKNGSGKELEFPWEQLKSMGDVIGRHVKFINNPKLSNLVVTKQIVNPDGTETEDEDVTNDYFEFKLELDLNAGEAYSPYELSYSKTDKDGNVTKGTLSANGYFQLNNKDSITFEGLPQGITYKVVETPRAGYKIDSYVKTGKIDNSTVTISYVNKIIKMKIPFTKYFDGNVETTANRFTFDLYVRNIIFSQIRYEFLGRKTNDSNGKVYFLTTGPPTNYSTYYRIDEVDTTNPMINYGRSIYVKVEMPDGSTEPIITYYEDDQYTKVLEEARIDNTTKLGSITIKKVDRDTQNGLKGAKFKLVPAKVENEIWSDLTPTSFDEAIEYEVENDDGTLTFTNLNIGTALPYHYQLYETVAPSGHQLLGSPIKITIDENTTDFSGTTWNYKENILVNDAKDNVLPLTGGTGWMVLGIMAIIFLLAGAIIYFRNGKRT